MLRADIGNPVAEVYGTATSATTRKPRAEVRSSGSLKSR
jgi:hypothetical protein